MMVEKKDGHLKKTGKTAVILLCDVKNIAVHRPERFLPKPLTEIFIDSSDLSFIHLRQIADELINSDVKKGGQARQKGDIRKALPRFPFGYRSLGDPHVLCQGILGKAFLFSFLQYDFTDLDFLHSHPSLNMSLP